MAAPKASGRSDTEIENITSAIRRSRPSRTRPRLPTEVEERLAEIEQRNAECYASMETFTQRLAKFADELNQPDPPVTLAKPESWDDDDSLVQSIDNFRSVASNGRRD